MAEKSFNVMRDLQGYFKKGERRAIYNSAAEEGKMRDMVLIRLLWFSGRRISEILNVKIHEIDFEINKISFHIDKKTEKRDGIRQKKDLVKLKPMDKDTSNLIKQFIDDSELKPSDYLFKSDFKPDRPISRQRAFQIIRRYTEKIGIEKVGGKKPHPHHFRHSYAVDMARKLKTPADVRKLQILMEHSNLAVTEQYLQFADEELADMVENIGD